MHPAFSVIFFTVASGAGYGLFIVFTLVQLFGWLKLSAQSVLIVGIIALVLITAGLLSSTFHLANPKNAWRAFFRFRTSWLSREGVFAVLFYPLGLAYLYSAWLAQGGTNPWVILFGLGAVLLAFVTVFSTGMIYACLKTIRQWNTALTPTNYVLLALASGTVLLVCLSAIMGYPVAPLAALATVLVFIAAITKAIYYFWIKTVTGPTINTATGFTQAQVRLLDTGHSAGTFLTDEFAYQAPQRLLKQLKLIVYGLAFLVPLLLMALLASGYGGWPLALLAVVSLAVGLGVERWLFFAEARHVVNLYHGAQHT